MQPTVTTKKITTKLPQIQQVMARLQRAQVLVGIPAARSSRRSAGINNAELLFIHTEGSPAQNIPARPVLKPAIANRANWEVIERQMRGAAQGALEGNEAALPQGLGRAGTAAMNAAKSWFTDPHNGWAPNSPATIARKGSSNPLIDTSQLRRAISYVVDEDGTA